MIARMRGGLVVVVLLLILPATAVAADFPRSFLWGTAISGFQSEMGGRPANVDRGSDWYVWTHDRENRRWGVVTQDLPERGAGHWNRFASDIRLAAEGLHQDAFRISIEWSRIFPRSTTSAKGLGVLDRLANKAAVRHYRAVLRRIRARGMRTFVTLNHFTLPSWLHDPLEVRRRLSGRDPDAPLPAGIRRGGWLDAGSVAEFRKYAEYVAWKLGRLVDYWAPINEPVVVAASGYVNVAGAIEGNFPPGVLSFYAANRVVRNLARASAVAYRAIHTRDRRARVGPVHNMVAFTPADPSSLSDRRGAEHADYLFNRLYLNAVVRGEYDRDADGVIEAGERVPRRAGRADFIGVNYYFRGRVTGLDAPLSRSIQVLDFVPSTFYRTKADPDRPACPTTCSEFGTEIYPDGFGAVLRTAGSYGLPLIVTENGIADADDDQRPGYIVDHLRVLRDAMRAGTARVRGYFHWSLMDNFEWAEGYAPKFGLYDIRRRPRPSARFYAAISRTGLLPR
jgi:beta-galactosidase